MVQFLELEEVTTCPGALFCDSVEENAAIEVEHLHFITSSI